jgi:hypothetical protein
MKKSTKNKKRGSKATKKSKQSKKAFGKLLLIIVIIGLFLILDPFSSTNNKKTFEYEGMKWTKGNYDGVEVYSPEMVVGKDYDLYLRKDPRLNEAIVTGEFNTFADEGYISLSPELESCGWEIARITEELESFLKLGIGLESVEIATSDAATALEKEDIDSYKSCFNSFKKTVILLDIGAPQVIQEDANKFCYKINVENCKDVASIEKFMTRVVLESKSGESKK